LQLQFEEMFGDAGEEKRGGVAALSAAAGGLMQELVLAGTTAVIVVNVTHPIDMVKTRLQAYDNFSLSAMVQREGVSSFYKGIKPAYIREATYTSLKLGLYGPIKTSFGAKDNDAPFVLKFAAGSVAGIIGAVAGNPFDVLKTLMIADKEKPRSMTVVTKEVMKERGIEGFYRGVQVNAVRACILNGTKMACYDQIKGIVVNSTGWQRKDLKTQFCSAFGAGFCMAITVTPSDAIRTQLMADKEGRFKGVIDCAIKTVKVRGVFGLYRGFLPFWFRAAPQATLQLLVFEQLRSLAGMKTI